MPNRPIRVIFLIWGIYNKSLPLYTANDIIQASNIKANIIN